MKSERTGPVAANQGDLPAARNAVSRLVLIAGTAVLLLALSALTVRRTAQADDVIDVTAGDVAGLISAIEAANADPAADTIRLENGTYTLTALYDSNAGLPAIISPVTIEGNGATIRRDPNSVDFRVFSVAGDGDLTLRHLTVSGGSIPFAEGGGIMGSTGSSVTIDNSTVTQNAAAYGGGGVSTQGTLTMINSAVTSNTSGRYGGGLVVNSGATAAITNCTMSGNAAGLDGGAVAVAGELRVAHATIVSNTAVTGGGGVYQPGVGVVRLSHSIVSGNRADHSHEVLGLVSVNAYNLFGHGGETDAQAFSDTATLGSSDITATSDGTDPTALDAILAPLAHNGGDTRTHALVAGSPAVEGGDPGFTPPPPYDQRGPSYQRIVGGRIDIGAYEYGARPVGGFTRPGAASVLPRPWVGLAVLAVVAAVGALVLPRLRR